MAPTFAFTLEGQEREYHSPVCSTPHPAIGDTRELRINPANPDHVGQYQPAFLWFLLGAPVGLGVGLLGRRAFKRANAVATSPDYRTARIAQLEAELQYLRDNG